jgi:putative copper export protein
MAQTLITHDTILFLTIVGMLGYAVWHFWLKDRLESGFLMEED